MPADRALSAEAPWGELLPILPLPDFSLISRKQEHRNYSRRQSSACADDLQQFEGVVRRPAKGTLDGTQHARIQGRNSSCIDMALQRSGNRYP